MLFKQLFLAAAASAFLIVPDISTEAIDPAPIPESETAPIEPPTIMLDRGLQLPCKQCRGHDAKLRLDFAVENGTKLTLNGFELYPEADPWNGDLVTTMVKADGREGKQRLGYSLLTVPLAFDEDQQLELIDLVFRVIEVGNTPVDKVPIVKLGLIRTKTDEIVVGNMQLIEPARQHCSTAWCQLKVAIHDALRGFIRASGCGRFKSHGHTHAHAHAHGQGQGHDGAHGHSHGHGHGHGHGALPGSMTDANGNRHDHHRHDHHHQHHAESYYSAKTHTRARLLRSIISHVVLPVVVGVTAGVSLAFVGIFVCGIVYRIITAFRRRCPRAHVAGCPRARSPLRRERSADAEKQRLMDDEESQESTPPAYRDALQE